MTSSLMGFTSDSISPLRTVNLHVMFGDEPFFKMMMVRFMVVNILSAYNIIIGRPMLNRLRAMVLTYHIVIKLPMRIGIGESRRNPRESC